MQWHTSNLVAILCAVNDSLLVFAQNRIFSSVCFIFPSCSFYVLSSTVICAIVSRRNTNSNVNFVHNSLTMFCIRCRNTILSYAHFIITLKNREIHCLLFRTKRAEFTLDCHLVRTDFAKFRRLLT